MKPIIGALALALTLVSIGNAQLQNPISGVFTVSSTDCLTDGSCVTLQIPTTGARSVVVQTTTKFAADLRFEATSDGGLTWLPVYGVALGATTPLASAPVNGAATAGNWRIDPTGLTAIRVRCNQIIYGNGNVTLKAVQ